MTIKCKLVGWKEYVTNFLFFMFALGAALLLVSCDDALDLCGGTGTLTVQNESTTSTHAIIVDGIRFATLGPDEEEELELTEGQHEVEFRGIGINGGGCAVGITTIVECKIRTLACRQ